jgi:hypothetical protein
MPSKDLVARQLQELEESLLDPCVRKSERVSQLLAEDFVEFGSSGRVFTREQVVEALRTEPPVRITAAEFAVRSLGPDTALVTYLACRQGEPPVHTRRSSLWRRRSGQWQMVFHEGTIAKVSTQGRPTSP